MALRTSRVGTKSYGRLGVVKKREEEEEEEKNNNNNNNNIF